ncbi:MAG: BamA/TamA family outer membrane protein [Alphaproteobacteria bacterium]|nr:BamA/TamA family outer membrane protein [Alphaproteobacteria bacterium]
MRYAFAIDPQPYTIRIDDTGDTALNSILSASSQLADLRKSAPVPPFGLIERARADIPRFQTALDSFGYYQNKIAITIEGLALADSGLLAVLDGKAGAVSVHVVVEKGPLYHLGTVTLDGDVPQAGRSVLKIRSGDPAVAAAVLDAGAKMVAALQEDGYAFANVAPPIALADDEQHLINVTYQVNAGQRATIGQIHFKGLKDVAKSFAQKALTIKPGERYRPSRIEEARQSLAALGVFSGVSVEAAHEPSPDGRLALTFDVAERARHTVSLSGTYSTDLGVSLSAGWSHHNLLGNAEQLNLKASGTGLGTASAGLGYSLAAQFIKPLFLKPNQTLEFDLSGVKQQLEAYDQTAETLAAYVRRKFSAQWSGGIGVSLTYDQVAQQGTTRLYQLAGVPVTVNYDSTGVSDILSDPTSGARLSLAVTPTQSFGAGSLTFGVLQASGSTYFDFGTDGRSVVALRALAGSILGGTNLQVPPDQRLYAGGSATVRGYAYQSIGPQFADGNPVGAKSVDAATAEFRQRIGEDWGAAGFVDAGQASASGLPFSGAVRVGAGLGGRYYTSIGVIRVDVAVPLTPVRGGDKFELYIGLGQAF